MIKKKEFLARIVKEGKIKKEYICEESGRTNCKANCPLYKIEGRCSDALQIYIKRMKRVDRLEFLIAIQ